MSEVSGHMMMVMPADEVDVRDMLCAQALQLVARAARALPRGSSFTIVCNAADVSHDVLAWAGQMKHEAAVIGTRGPDTSLRIQIGASR